jgi:hypothetical protein
MFSSADLFLAAGTSGMILQNHRWFPVSTFKINKKFQRSKKNFEFDFVINKEQKIVQTISAFTAKLSPTVEEYYT